MKKDIKYIIKRIFIGVCIAFGVMLVKSLPVFAEEKNINAYLKYGSYESDRRFYIQSSEITTDIKIFDKIKVFDNTNFSLNVKTSDRNSYNEKNIKLVLLDKTNNVYYFLVLKTYIFANNGSIKDSYKKLNLSFSDSDMSYSLLNDGNSISGNITFPLAVGQTALPYDNSYNVEENLNNETYYFNIPKSNSNDYKGRILGSYTDFSNFVICYKSDDFPTTEQIFINNMQIEDNTVSSIPTGYEKIDMKDKYAVVFYSKDVRKLEKKCTNYEDIYNTDEEGNVTIEQKCTEESYYLNFYRKGKFNIKISDIENMNYVDSIVTGASDTELVDETFIINKNEFKNSIIFYNNEQNPITDEEGNVTLKDYGGVGEIYFDPTIYGYFIIDNPDSEINEDINYIDENGNEKTTHVDTLPKQDASYDFNIDFDEESINKFDVKSGFLSFIKMINDGVGFFKKYIGNFMKGVPEFVYYFIIFVPILSIIVAVIKIVNR